MHTVTQDMLSLIRPEHLNPLVRRVIAELGQYVTIKMEDEVDDIADETNEYEFPERTANTLLCGGEDSWGALVGAFVLEGEFVIAANFGDDGVVFYSLSGTESPLCHVSNVLSAKDIIIGRSLDELNPELAE
jgi:hypothetical protein